MTISRKKGFIPLSRIEELKRLKIEELGLNEVYKMDNEEREQYISWIESNPMIPAGKSHLEVWKEKTSGALIKWL